MKRISGVAVMLALVMAAGAAGAVALSEADRALPNIASVDRTIMVPMRDGVRLATDVLHPRSDTARKPAILFRTPYPLADERMWIKKYWPRFLEEGYVIVLQNERGKYWSEGNYTFLPRAREDGYDTVDWISRQPWSNGKVGTFGCSSTAESQLPLMTQDHPAHAAAIPMAPAAAIGSIGPHREQGMFYRGGVPYTLWAGWYYLFGHRDRPTLPTQNMSQEDISRVSSYFDLQPNVLPALDYGRNAYRLPFGNIVVSGSIDPPRTDFDDFIRRSPGDPDWSQQGFVSDKDVLKVPALWLTSWYDATVSPNLAMFNHARETAPDASSANQYMVIAAGLHCRYGMEQENMVIGDRPVGDPRFDFQSLWVEWFDLWLKGKSNDALKAPRVRYYSFGANRWQSADTWPPAGVSQVRYYLSSNRGANSRLGDGILSTQQPGTEGKDSYIYDPMVPYRSPGGEYVGLSPDYGAYDQSVPELRNDVLVYTSAPLQEAVEVTGDITARLYVSSDAPDTDFVVRLIDVAPDGRAYHLVDTIQRARYREGYDREVFMQPGQVYPVTLGPMSFSNHFLPGHRIRVEIASSHFPHYERNLNTGGANHDESAPRVAVNTIHHSSRYASYIELPIRTEPK